MSAAEMREAAVRAARRRAATHDDDSPAATLAELIALDIAAIPLPDEEGMVERVARAMWAVECEEAAEEYKRDNRPVPLQWADPWVEGGSGVRQQKPYLRRARAALRAINGGEP